MDEKTKKIIEDIKNELLNMKKEDFNKLLKKHKNGDIYKILLETNYFNKEKNNETQRNL